MPQSYFKYSSYVTFLINNRVNAGKKGAAISALPDSVRDIGHIPNPRAKF